MENGILSRRVWLYTPCMLEPYRIFPPATKEQKAELRTSIESVGLKHSIILDEHHQIIDGHERKIICEPLGIDWLKGADVRIGLTDSGLKHLKGLTNLGVLNLNNTKITDAGLVHLKGLTKLKVLNLDETNVTDTGLENLKGLTNLFSLDLTKTKVTDDGVKKLQKSLPKCNISH